MSTTSSPPDRETLSVRRIGRRRLLVTVLMVGLVVAGLWFLARETGSSGRVLEALRRADPWWLGLCLVASTAGYLGYALLYQAVVRTADGPRPPLSIAVKVTVAVFGSSVIATAAGRLGAEFWSLRRLREPPARAWARVLALNTAAWALLAALAAAGALALLVSGGKAPLAVELAWLLILPVCVPPAGYLSSPKRARLTEDQGSRIRRTAAAVVRSLAVVRALMGRGPSRARGLAGGLLYWSCELVVTWAALRAFGISLGPAALAVAYATGYIATMLPLPAGGVGGVDAATTYALTLVGVPLGPALLGTLVQRLFSYWLPLAAAIAGGHFIRHLGRDLDQVRRRGGAGT